MTIDGKSTENKYYNDEKNWFVENVHRTNCIEAKIKITKLYGAKIPPDKFRTTKNNDPYDFGLMIEK